MTASDEAPGLRRDADDPGLAVVLEDMARQGSLTGAPAPAITASRLGAGESYTAWLLRPADQGAGAHVLRLPRRPAAQMPRPMAEEYAALQRVPADLGSSAVAMEPSADNPLASPYIVTTYVPGRPLSRGDWYPGLVPALAELIARFHRAVDEDAPPQGPLPTATHEAEALLSWWGESHPGTLADPRARPLLEPWRRALAACDEAFEGQRAHRLIHGDVVLPNLVLGPDGRLRLIDLEWSGPGDRAKDLALVGGAITGGPWYAPIDGEQVRALVEDYARLSATLGAMPEDAGRLARRREAWELLDRLDNLLYCLSRATEEEGRRYARWADELAAGLARVVSSCAP
ncbi:aminoglycoside phosphotransferase family protein [Actinomyces slackii]|uniref:aminoglycoside phosphotransferase family protein n=1 Tax=Actinomyces slackii TaxID=52774 RepID=UPI001E2D89F8|nr:aminoglycoside phosphotransferase family protein [Actinomyces slackii]